MIKPDKYTDMDVRLGVTKKHPKCMGYKEWTGNGYEFDCDYNTKLDCGECKYGGGRKDPEAKCNQLDV